MSETRSETLSEHASKELLTDFAIPFAREGKVADAKAAVSQATAIGYPVVLKLCGDTIAHKTERDLVRLGLADPAAVERAASELVAQDRVQGFGRG